MIAESRLPLDKSVIREVKIYDPTFIRQCQEWGVWLNNWILSLNSFAQSSEVR